MGRVNVYCYYSISKGDLNSYAIRIGNKEYATKLEDKTFIEVCKHSIKVIEKLVGKDFQLYCNEVESVRNAVKDTSTKYIDGLYSQNPRYAKDLKELVKTGKVGGRWNKEDIERDIRESIVTQHNALVGMASLVKSDFKHIEEGNKPVNKTKKVPNIQKKSREDRIKELEEELGIRDKEEKALDVYVKWSKGYVNGTETTIKCACITEDLNHAYQEVYKENSKIRGSSKPSAIKDILDNFIIKFKDEYKHFIIHIDNDVILRSIRNETYSKFKRQYDNVREQLYELNKQGIIIDFTYVNYKSGFSNSRLNKTLNELLSE